MCDFAQESCWLSIIACFLLAGFFVGSLYVWPSKHVRNHPSTIKQRFFRIFIVILISPFILQFFITSSHFTKFSTLELIGFRLSGLIPAAILPLLLTMVLFLGPLCMQDGKAIWTSFLSFNFWWGNVTDLVWLRNVIVGPLAEEFSFRACMVPLLLQCFKPSTAIFVCSLFFGLAHVHHVVDRYKAGDTFIVICLSALIEFSYTTLFGAYSAYVFYKTGHFIAPVIVHSFCNVMALPDFGRIFIYENPKKLFLILLHISGVIIWYLLLSPLLNPNLYDNYIYFQYIKG